eukprot:GHVS01104337.1.p2 GENE.GHVS01104337.1~~GHVS01104337.1.p2  ORF type:complete len:267 (+),score=39.47 GHVS01104337.1:1869-2669(+)
MFQQYIKLGKAPSVRRINQLKRIMFCVLLEFPSFLSAVPKSMHMLVERYQSPFMDKEEKSFHADLVTCLESLSLDARILSKKGPYRTDVRIAAERPSPDVAPPKPALCSSADALDYLLRADASRRDGAYDAEGEAESVDAVEAAAEMAQKRRLSGVVKEGVVGWSDTAEDRTEAGRSRKIALDLLGEGDMCPLTGDVLGTVRMRQRHFGLMGWDTIQIQRKWWLSLKTLKEKVDALDTSLAPFVTTVRRHRPDGTGKQSDDERSIE